ncbi:pyridoxal phosphate-dependent aminotransferase [Alphaproteobacteria bacterium]|nr:pyridoxal phosphate-dependent aminotransferase [Alphaproteobacteria bacterium]
MLADTIKNIKPSATLSISQKANRLKQDGHPVISLSVGESDFPTPPHVIEAAKKAMDNGETRYTAVAGTRPLRQAICDHLSQQYEYSYTPEQILVSNGAKQVLFNAFQATLNPGDEVIIPAPYWVSYPPMVKINKGHPVIVDCLQEQDLLLTPGQLEKAITPRTKWVVLNSPSNPSGATYTKAQLQALGDVLLKYPHVWVMVDEIYDRIVYLEEGFTSFLQACPKLKERTLLINGVSKSYAMTGWRIGFGAGPQELIEGMSRLQSQSTSGACSISQAAALAAYSGEQSYLAHQCTSFKKRRDLVVTAINNIPGLKAPAPMGAFYMLVDCRDSLKKLGLTDDVALCDLLLDEANIALVPGSAFGAPGFVRLSYALDDATLQAAMARLKEALFPPTG